MQSQTAKPFDGAVLIVDDDKDVLFTAELVLSERFSRVTCLSDPMQIPAALGSDEFDIVVLDMNFSRGADTGAEGMYWLQQIRTLAPQTRVIMTTAFGEIDLAVEAIKNGAVDFLMKPWENEKLETTVSNCFQLARSERQVKRLEDTQHILEEQLEEDFHEIIGASPSMRRVFELIDKVAMTDANVLVLGENGTGKELVARAIHRQSARSSQAMISVDMGSISESLFESEMFGHKKGAFTDARADRAGRFELAYGGTLFLDEIGNLSPSAQVKLLGALERREIVRVGGSKPIPIDIRLISATNIPRTELSNGGNFRMDLLYRINTVEISLPPLRERHQDIPALIDHYLRLLCGKYKKTGSHVSQKTIKALQGYRWPGNIRELKHSLERAIIVSKSSELRLEDLLLRQEPEPKAAIDFNLERIEKKTIENALQAFEGNLTLVAKELGLGRTTLYRKLKKYGVSC
ncbi:sigma-54-dependent Fis family transcriptional regulator [Exilibacterium tricleocarpae]|uniref:Sigma-54-dependent Fis family transcriptional regulator n=1 Tax=Exilibacterium tricleocarpae TaxID=2591008 RepID=A0A545TFP6_9GAMM|nr:sigma-54 dependent transcriptional regulator [Exilibacterium tricleocarpae]TQV76043.1 sigma-54-dependent Fis family transcriptional regulator [Exilibacterium tricleocarpae]